MSSLSNATVAKPRQQQQQQQQQQLQDLQKPGTANSQVPEEQFSYIKRVGNYLVGRILGEGSFAKVRVGLHLPTAEKVAIKVLDKHRAANDNYMEVTIRREGRLLRRIRPHPNIVQLYEVMETANSLYLVLELCDGGDFLDLVASRGRLSEEDAKMYLRQIIGAVSHLHSFGILHRDLKIENFMLDSSQQQIKIIDLGLSTASPGSAARTQCGSPAYAAPELIRSPHYGPEVDVWSIGVDLFAMLTGGLPFTVEPFSIKNLYSKMVAREMNPLPSDTSSEAIDLLQRLLEPDPRLRISLESALAHPWLKAGRKQRQCPPDTKSIFLPQNTIKIINGAKVKGDPYANNDPSILDLSIATRAATLAGSSLGSLLRDVAAAVPSNLAATYHLLVRHNQRQPDQPPDNRSLSPGSTNEVSPAPKAVNNAKVDMDASFLSTNSKIPPRNPQPPKSSMSEKESSATSRAAYKSIMQQSVTSECRPRSAHISASESEPCGGVQTLERRRIHKPRLTQLLHRAHGIKEVNEDAEQQPPRRSRSQHHPNHHLKLEPDDSVHTARYLGANDNPGDVIRWAATGDTTDQCLMTSCCGELPLKPAPSSTPTPPHSMQMSHIVAQQSPKVTRRNRMGMFTCVGQRLKGSEVISKQHHQCFTPDLGYGSSDTTQLELPISANHHSRLMSSSRTPPPSNAAAYIVKPAVHAITSAARKALCGSSPQPPNGYYTSTLDRRPRISHQAAV